MKLSGTEPGKQALYHTVIPVAAYSLLKAVNSVADKTTNNIAFSIKTSFKTFL